MRSQRWLSDPLRNGRTVRQPHLAAALSGELVAVKASRAGRVDQCRSGIHGYGNAPGLDNFLFIFDIKPISELCAAKAAGSPLLEFVSGRKTRNCRDDAGLR